MTSEWDDFQLEDVADLNGGYAFKSEEYTETGHFVLRTVNITDDGRISTSGAVYVSSESAKKYERFQLQELDTLFVMVGATLGKTGLVTANDLPALLNQNMWVIRAKKGKVDALYLHYAFKVLSKPLSSLASGSARGFVKRDDFRRMEIRLPKLKNQKNISSLLGALDDRITLLRETNSTLEGIAQAMFKSWFVDFDPVRAKAEGRLPEGIDEATAALFPASFEESELGSIPSGWSVEPIGELLYRPRISKRYTKKQVMEFGECPVYEQGASILLGFHNETPSCNASAEKPLFIFGDHTCITKISCEPFDISQNVILLEGSKRNSFWTYYAIQGKQNFEEYRRHWMELIVKKIVVPPLHICDLFSDLTTPLQLKTEANNKNIYTLTNLRDTLLPRLISGQLRIADAEAELEKVTA